jgi:hypothetical protein
MRNRQAMRFVNKTRSSPAADEADGRKAPGPANEKLATEVVATRLEEALASALRTKAAHNRINASAAVREAVRLYVDHAPATSDRRQRSQLFGVLIQLRADLERLESRREEDLAEGFLSDPADADQIRRAIHAVEQAARKLV